MKFLSVLLFDCLEHGLAPATTLLRCFAFHDSANMQAGAPVLFHGEMQ